LISYIQKQRDNYESAQGNSKAEESKDDKISQVIDYDYLVGLVPEKFGFSAVKEWQDEPSF